MNPASRSVLLSSGNSGEAYVARVELPGRRTTGEEDRELTKALLTIIRMLVLTLVE